MKILAVSDVIVDWIYSPLIYPLRTEIDLAIGCGDLPADYLEFIVSSLDIPVFYVQGNHSVPPPVRQDNLLYSQGSLNLHSRVERYREITFAGVEGSINYNSGNYQYSQVEMWLQVIKLLPRLLANREKYGRFLNVLVTHAPPWGVHDQSDLAHHGIKAFRWLIEQLQPDLHLHGHIHIYRPDTITETRIGRTTVVNVFGYKKLLIG